MYTSVLEVRYRIAFLYLFKAMKCTLVINWRNSLVTLSMLLDYYFLAVFSINRNIPQELSLFLAFFDTLCDKNVYDNYREQQLRNRQQTESEGESSGPESRRTTTRNNRRRGVAPPVYSLIDTGSELTTDSEFETEAETSLSEPEYTEHEPDLSPPPYSP